MLTPAPDAAVLRPYLDQYDRVKAALPGGAHDWLRVLREAGRDRFAAAGFPTTRVEAWKYTSLRPLEKAAFAPAPAAGIDALPTVRAEGSEGPRVVFVDGRFRGDLSRIDGLPLGVEITTIAALLAGDAGLAAERLGHLVPADGSPLAALNTALFADGPVIRIARGSEAPELIEIVHVSMGTEPAFHPRTLLIAEDNSRAVVVEHHVGVGGAATFANHVSEVFVGDGATLHHYKAQREGADAAFHVATTGVRVGRDALYDGFTLTLGGRLTRNEAVLVLAGTGATCRSDGAYLVRGTQHCDTTTVIEHAQPHGSSRQVVKGVIDDTARAVFQGKILVRPGAQKTDGHQLTRALLLSDTAEIDQKPELEIHADDVKCSHGATAGELDDDALFFLRARGIPKEEARGLLIGAFLAEAIDEIAEEPVREAFNALVAQWRAAR